MNPDFKEKTPPAVKGESGTDGKPSNPHRNPLAAGLDFLLNLGLGESILRIGTNALSLILVAAVIWMIRQVDMRELLALRPGSALAAGPTPASVVDPGLIPMAVDESAPGIPRYAQERTTIPSRPRNEVVKYTVQEGDTVFGIAEKFGLRPQTILWGNYHILLDDPHALTAGQVLNILPVDGTYYEWQAGDGLNGVAEFFGVTPEVIVNYPPNGLDPATIGDYSRPNIKPGTWLIVPGGERLFISWSAPLGVTRENPASARVLGKGACDPVAGGAVGFGTFVWPTAKHYLSGFDYSPDSNHWGVDLAGNGGEGVYATDAGVVVYAGWNDYGYGNMIMIDHGNGFQSLYAHLNEIYVSCAQSVGQGDPIGAIGSTGRSSGAHLHFELRTTTYFVNPWDYLPPP